MPRTKKITQQNRRGVPTGAPETPENTLMPRTKKITQQKRRGAPSGAPETPENTDRPKGPSLQGTPEIVHPKRRGVPSGAPETLARTDRSKDPSLQGAPLQKEGLPMHAFAIAPDPNCPDGWQLPHHTLNILKDVDVSVNWPLLEKATLLLSLQGDEGRRVTADPALIIDAARHIAGHYRYAGKPIPTVLCVLI